MWWVTGFIALHSIRRDNDLLMLEIAKLGGKLGRIEIGFNFNLNLI